MSEPGDKAPAASNVPGREALSGQHFQEFLEYLQQQKSQGAIESFEPVLLEPHGGELNGFFFIKGEPSKLATLVASPEWVQHQVRAMLHMNGMALMRGVTGPAVTERMGIWMKAIPK